MAVGYDYLNARLKALKARLLPPARLRELAHLDGLPAFVAALLAATPYATGLRGAPRAVQGVAACEHAFTHRLSSTFRSLWSESGDDARVWLEVWLGPWDLANLKTLLRGWQARLFPEQIATEWGPTGALSDDDLRDLSTASTIRALADRLGARGGLSAALARVLRRREQEPLRRLEERLDEAWAACAVARIQQGEEDADTFAAFFAWEIDARNVMSALRLAREGGGEEAPFLSGGRYLTRERWTQVATRPGLDAAFPALEGTPFFEAVRQEAPPFEPERALGRVQRRVDALVLQHCADLYHRSDPLGVGVLLWFVQLQVNEVRNVRLIAHGLDHRLPPGFIEEGLVLA